MSLLRRAKRLLAGSAVGLALSASSIRGVAVDAVRGVPLRNAQVGVASLDGKTEQEVMTSEGGTFAFHGLPAGRYMLVVNHYSSSAGGAEGVLRSRLIVSLDGSNPVDGLQISPSPSYTISGTVRHADDQGPLGDTLIEAITAEYHGGAKSLISVERAITDDLGQFRIRNLPAGSYYLRASRAPLPAVAVTPTSKAGLKPRRVFEVSYYPGVSKASEAVRIDVGPGTQPSLIDMRLRELGPGLVKGHVCPVASLPAGSVQVGLFSPDASKEMGALAKFAVNGQGDFVAADLPPGIHLVCASTSERPPKFADCASIAVREDATNVADLCPRPAGTLAGRLRVAGTDSPGLRLDGLEVGLYPQDSAPRAYGSGGVFRVQAEGRFIASGLVPGAYQLNIAGLPAPWYVERIGTGGADTGTSTVTIAPGGALTADVILAKGGAVQGEITGKAFPANLNVILIPSAALRNNPLRFYATVVNDDGHFRLDGVAPGTYTAIPAAQLNQGQHLDPQWAARHESSGIELVISPAGETRVEIAVPPGIF